MMHFLTLTPLLFAFPVLSTLLFTDFPHLLVSLNKDQANSPLGTFPFATVSNSVWTEVNFDVHPKAEYPAAICRINFHINTNGAKNAPRYLDGDAPYTFQVFRLQPEINKWADTWNNHPKLLEDWPTATITLTEQGDVTVDGGWFECPFGQVAQFLVKPVGDKDFTYYWYELDYPAIDGGPHGITLEMHS